MKFPISVLCFSLITLSCSQSTPVNNTDNMTSMSKKESPKNIIMIIADGMGPVYPTAYRYFSDDPATDIIEETVFDRHLIGLASTYPDKNTGIVTDSAAAATALASGVKTYNGAIGVDVNKNPVESVLHRAKKQGKKTGVVVTSTINHATPAAYLTHNESRQNYNEIADSYLNKNNQADIMFGGGSKHFIREDRNLIEEFQQSGFHYIDSYKNLDNLPQNKPILGLFNKDGLPWALDDKDQYRLSTMTKVATNYLDNISDDNGYFMLIEASQIDWAGHNNDAASAMWEMEDLAKTLEYLERYVANNPDTVVILTADHNTGGFSIGADGLYQWKPEVLRTMTQSADSIAKHLAKNNIEKDTVNKMLGFELSDDDIQTLQATKKSVSNELSHYLTLSIEQQKNIKKPKINKALYTKVTGIISKKTTTGWTSSGHTGTDVPVYSFGKGSEIFAGFQDNTDIAKKIFTLLEQ